MIYKSQLKKLKNNFGKVPRALAERAFLAFLISLFIALIFGLFLFYKYSVLAQKAEPEVEVKPAQFKEALYQKILGEWKVREEKFEKADTKEYPDLFQPRRREELEAAASEKKLSEERTEELLSYPQIQELLNTPNLYEFYTTKGENFLALEERAQIWQELELGSREEYEGSYYQNIRLLRELKEELTQ